MTNQKLFILVFSAISVLVSALFWSGFSNNQAVMAVLVLVGLSLDCLKIHLLSSIKETRAALKVFSILLYGVLALISVVGCMSMIHASERHAAVNSHLVVELKAEQQGLKQQLQNLLDVQRADFNNNYRARSISLNNEIERLRHQISTVNQSIQKQQDNNTTGALSKAALTFATALPFSEGKIKDGLSLMLSLILEASLLLLLLQDKHQEQTRLEQQTYKRRPGSNAAPKHQALPSNVVRIRGRDNPEHENMICPSMKQVAYEQEASTSEASSEQHKQHMLLEKMKQDMCEGRVKTCITDCKLRYKRGTKTIQACFNALIEEGFLKKVNKRYSFNANFENDGNNPIKIGVF